MKGSTRVKTVTISSMAIIISSIIIGLLIYYFASNAIITNISEDLTEIAVLGAKAVENSLKGSMEVIERIAEDERISDPGRPLDEKLGDLKNSFQKKSFNRISIADASGYSKTTDGISLYVGDREYYKLAMTGQKNISDPVESRADGEMVVTFAVPIVNGEDIIGVLYSTQKLEFLNKIVDGIKLGENGRSFIIDSAGTAIAHEKRGEVSSRVNILLDWRRLGLDKTLHDFMVAMQKNDKGAGQYIYDGAKMYAGYANIPGTSWYFGISAPKSQAFKSINHIYFYLILLLLLSVVIFSATQIYIGLLRKDLDDEKNTSAAAYEELSEKDKKIDRLAYYDSLTGLPNRTNLKGYFNSNISGKKTKAALLYMDLDNFKNINDTFGHNFGDRLLVETAESIKTFIKDRGAAARLGGDDFIILIDSYRDLDEVRLTADKLLKSFEEGFQLDESLINISASMGIALYPDDGQTFGQLMKCADTAMYAAKEHGKRKYTFFDQNMYDRVAKSVTIQNGLRKALDNNEFLLHYQPQFETKTRRVTGFEALLRWRSPDHEIIYPADFIGIAETSGLIIPLGEWVLDQACSFMKCMKDMGHEDLSISVNVSVIQLLQENFVSMVKKILKRKNLDPSSLDLEITESVLIKDIDCNLKKIKELRELGVKISLDDFGTGYSSLTYLRDLPINILKIDKSFIDDIAHINDNNGLTGSIIALAHDLGLEVVAEGVEKEEQFDYLEYNNCDMIQGYLFSKPLPKDEAIEYMFLRRLDHNEF